MGPKVNSFRDIDLSSCAATLLSVHKMFKFAAIHPLRRRIVDSLTRSS
jgi:hypothetical protein